MTHRKINICMLFIYGLLFVRCACTPRLFQSAVVSPALGKWRKWTSTRFKYVIFTMDKKFYIINMFVPLFKIRVWVPCVSMCVTVLNPFLFIRGLSWPRCVQASLYLNCPKLIIFPYSLLPVSCGDIGLNKVKIRNCSTTPNPRSSNFKKSAPNGHHSLQRACLPGWI